MEHPRGNSLIIVLVLITILLLLALGANALVRSGLSKQQQALQGHSAYYSAEAATELALIAMRYRLPGFEHTLDPISMPQHPLRAGMPLRFSSVLPWLSYTLENRTANIPSAGNELSLIPQVPVSIPLFEDHSDAYGATTRIEDFQGQFEFTYDITPPNHNTNQACLRWDLSGFKPGTTDTRSIGGLLRCHERTIRSATTTEPFLEPDSAIPRRTVSISQFLTEHQQVYLTLTSLHTSGDLTLTFRTTPTTSTVANPLALVTAIGSMATDPTIPLTTQLLEFTLPRGQILPIFSYTIFQ